jgi:hypothetical protein
VTAVESFPLDGGLVLRAADRDRLVLLNDVAAVVWELRAAGLEVSDISGCLAERFARPLSNVVADVDALVAGWRAEGLLQEAAPPARSLRPPALASSAAPLVDATVRLARTTIRIRSHVPALGQMIAGRLLHRAVTAPPDVTVDIHADGPDYLAVCDGREVVREDDVPHTVSSLYRLFLRLDNPGEEFIAFAHAACLVSGGRPLLACGCSGRGKTTLAAGLLARGFTYLGDEISGVVAGDLSVRSLPTALSIKSAGMDTMHKVVGVTPASWPSTVGAFVDPATLGPTATEAGRPAALVFPRFTAGAALASARLAPLEAFAELIDAGIAVDQSLFGRGTPARLIEWVETTPCYRLTYGTFDDAYRGVCAVLGG